MELKELVNKNIPGPLMRLYTHSVSNCISSKKNITPDTAMMAQSVESKAGLCSKWLSVPSNLEVSSCLKQPYSKYSQEWRKEGLAVSLGNSQESTADLYLQPLGLWALTDVTSVWDLVCLCLLKCINTPSVAVGREVGTLHKSRAMLR